MSGHTPGPWRVLPEEVDRAYIRVRGTQLGMRYKVADVPNPNHEGALQREAEETRANARLIAAAPDLLEVCQRIAKINVFSVDNDVAQIVMQARTVFEMATGEKA